MKIKNILTSMTLLIAIALVYSFSPGNDQEKWVAPDKYKTMKNPVAGDEDALETGEELYMQHCKSCHGKEGIGDGTKAAELKTSCGDFSESDFQSQSDGSIFFKTKEGRDEMPSFAKKIPDDEDIWSIVAFVRTLGE